MPSVPPPAHLLRAALSARLGVPVQSAELVPVGGGSINQTYRLVLNRRDSFFCKVNDAQRFPLLFEKEKSGLALLAAQDIFRLPGVILCEVLGNQQVLVLEWIEPGLKTGAFWEHFGRQLVAQHRLSQPAFGWQDDNYMGPLPQSNSPSPSWPEFFIQQRLAPQVQRAADRRLLRSTHLQQFETLYKQLPAIFPPVPPALLHGDLWSGNFLCDVRQQPVLIDPAVYYGHPAVDLAMTTLFGGFDPAFYASYFHHAPQPAHYLLQWDTCNLYPLLVHLNLFGMSYLADIEAILRPYK
jgi:fructosamine-3-kinase